MNSMRVRRFLKRGRAGQSIVILALGFIALLAFVGIVTDVSLLFVRYSTLRRAVDAAAVAAATQMRRIENTSATPGVDTGGSTSIANMNLAARQFLNLYSLDPSDVTVETCNSQLVEFQDDGQPTFTGIVNDSGRQVVSPLEQEKRYNEVCKDGRKLVRVTASIKSPTVFLRMLGMQDVTLTVASISETAVLDVALVLDVSESMLAETTYSDYEDVLGHPVARILPGRAPYISGVSNTPDMEAWWIGIEGQTETGINGYLTTNPTVTLITDDYTGETSEFQLQPLAAYKDTDGTYHDIDYSDWDSDSHMLRAACRTRFWPYAYRLGYGAQLTQTLYDEYKELFFNRGVDERAFYHIPDSKPLDPTNSASSAYYTYTGWVPTYDFYGCCNDPNGDGDFSDLACQPMRQARDASQEFLRRVDFPRGDAVAILTFSQSAHIMRPNGPGTDPWIRGNEALAEQVLTEAVGVRAEPVYYYDDPGSYSGSGTYHRWDSFHIGDNLDGSARLVGFDYNFWNNTAINSLTYYPVHNNCPYDMATLSYPYNPHAADSAEDEVSSPNWPLLYGIQTPGWLTQLGLSSFTVAVRSYDYRGSCRDTNIGGAMAASGNVFGELGQKRTEGSVWVMVLLSDGAAGASNPITKDDGKRRMSNPYGYNYDAENIIIRDPDVMSSLTAEYGSFGFCPYGPTPSDGSAPPASQRGELVLNNTFPYCSDVYPDSRHSCASTDPDEQDLPNDPRYLDLSETDNVFSCPQNYDVDDYARDWADYVAGVTQSNVSTTQLPVIFTIGFNLAFDDPTGACSGDAACLRAKHPEAYLGEELLRYIADAGDNFRMDDNFWQWRLGQSDLGVFTDPSTLSTSDRQVFYGQPGPCEDQNADPITYPPSYDNATNTSINHNLMTPGEDCGNYFNAPGQTELAEVFNEIASRMFTRLSQ